MKTRLEIDTDTPQKTVQAVKPSLDSNDKVSYTLKAEDNCITVEIEAHGLGPLRGCTDTAFRLISLAEKVRN